jgi:serine/threonine-protein phosphatase PGAM5
VASLYLVRHAEAAAGEASDPGLSALGRQQAARLADRLADLEVGAVLHSPLNRAAETAAVLADRLKVAATPSSLLADRTPVPSLPRRSDYPARYLPWLDETPAGERDVDAQALMSVRDELIRISSDSSGPLVLVTHAFVIGWLVCDALDAPSWRWLSLAPDNASLSILSYDGERGSRVIAFNDTGHLR